MRMIIKTANDLAAKSLAHEQDKARLYLSRTDWMVVRHAETGVPVPPEVLAARAKARDLLAS